VLFECEAYKIIQHTQIRKFSQKKKRLDLRQKNVVIAIVGLLHRVLRSCKFDVSLLTYLLQLYKYFTRLIWLDLSPYRYFTKLLFLKCYTSKTCHTHDTSAISHSNICCLLIMLSENGTALDCRVCEEWMAYLYSSVALDSIPTSSRNN